jgi:hypothetical protein
MLLSGGELRQRSGDEKSECGIDEKFRKSRILHDQRGFSKKM